MLNMFVVKSSNSLKMLGKRLFDLLFASIGSAFFLPLLIPICFLVWYQDKKTPFYLASRVGLNESIFTMYKLRSMVVNADKSGVDSTSADDSRITRIGHLIRRFKFDELTQLFNVLLGDMSLVGPRPNVENETKLYSEKEKGLLSVCPGITDFASIVFSDEGEILKGSDNPDLKYNQVIRPWKSRLGLFYVQNHGFVLDMKLILVTLIAIVARPTALKLVQKILSDLDADEKLVSIAGRREVLEPYPPPGIDAVVTI